ncbi:UDP-N-acetyl-D-mannosaminuronic acid transferase [Virgisporangium aliadipatigenens]|uniref:UDP-N-acetyl-D-mannosaminuronic acid transferase n=1 Tax=Virgisporangium aliadipatigenens TaxID=741659 RepID=A0A8J3YNP5_9ACTN|nr:WecB/TagA/CpsF family glycosyltransferase [Virgisporangium aliadipatigenens]GIJ47210.1 UDP-N-acetyl-D-mannosaminuronic acid transferase [Virgisporangium aliadipatigenens]
MIDRGRHSVLGVLVDAVDYAAAVARVLDAARHRRPFAATALAVHGVMTGVHDPAHRARLNSFDLVTPDGQPVRWALNALHRSGLADRVYGPRLMREVLARAADEGLPVYLYGSTPRTLERLRTALLTAFPRIELAGLEPSGFRAARPGEDAEIADRIRASGARLVLVGLGCPRQEIFAHALRPHLAMPLLAVGAAFDYFAGTLKAPPAWMQRHALEWLWRLTQDPRRLWRRYVLLNPEYLLRFAAQRLRLWSPPPAPAPAASTHSGPRTVQGGPEWSTTETFPV